ncbi:MAG: GlsB/YeaQ/YmgE family stress response membrane protein [Patescibacteria group bacterium]|nr:GlsB/YeaQ/YmgE family stress response membrane protein [Patescibacteria group bacterium]
MNIVIWIVFGLVVGWIAYMTESPRTQQGLVGSLVLGVVGSLVGGFIGDWIFGVPVGAGFNLASFLVAVIGGVVFLAVGRAYRRV